jgi:hypothetical protein
VTWPASRYVEALMTSPLTHLSAFDPNVPVFRQPDKCKR